MKIRLISASVISVMIVLTSIVMPCRADLPSSTEGTSVVNVLHVSRGVNYNEVQEVLDIADASALFEVRRVDLLDFNGGQPDDLSQYDVVTFGLRDCHDRGSYIGRISELRLYVENGGGIVWTHDTLEWPQDYGPEAEEPAGMDYRGPTTLRLMYEVQIVLDHEMIHEPFEIGEVGDFLPIQETHENGGEVTTADVVLKFSKWDGGTKNHYLTAHEWMNGRVVVDEIGHGITDCHGDFREWPSVLESRIFANALCWAGGGSCGLGVNLDIDPDTLNLGSKGKWVTAYLNLEDAEPEDVDISSVLLLEALSPERWDYQDGTLMLKFDREELQAILDVGESVEIRIRGTLKDERSFVASDYIRVINP